MLADVPITYIPNALPLSFTRMADFTGISFLTELRALSWEHREAPRQEYYCNDFPYPYVYGKGKGQRVYERRPYTKAIQYIRLRAEELAGCKFEVCFLNRYLDQKDQLGWHADDSPEMDDARPIAVVSFGVEREIWFRRKPAGYLDPRPREVYKLMLGNGSLCLMHPGMQDSWQHRIPKASFTCGERISLTFRGYVVQP